MFRTNYYITFEVKLKSGNIFKGDAIKSVFFGINSLSDIDKLKKEIKNHIYETGEVSEEIVSIDIKNISIL